MYREGVPLAPPGLASHARKGKEGNGTRSTAGSGEARTARGVLFLFPPTFCTQFLVDIICRCWTAD